MTTKTPVVAITGGIGSGKSRVAELMESWGALVVDADTLAREVVAPGTPGLTAVLAHFGRDLLLPDGSLNRPLLASIIFSDPEKRKVLEALLHPLIRERWLQQLASLQGGGKKLICYVIPLLFEAGRVMPEIDNIILVTAPEETRLHRVMTRDHCPRDVAELRLKAQLPDSEKIPKSDFVIVNDSTLDSLTTQTSNIFSRLTEPRADDVRKNHS